NHFQMPPRRAAAVKSQAATAAIASGSTPATTSQPATTATTKKNPPARKGSRKRAAPDVDVANGKADDADDADDKDEEEKPKRKRTKTAKSSALDSAAVAAPAAAPPPAPPAKSPTPDPPAKMVKIIQRGVAPVDPCSRYVSSHQVFVDGDQVYDAMLNQTDIGKNSNKFYVIQLLHPVGSHSAFILFTRWGRVGESGQQASKGPFGTKEIAISEFFKQFKSKTANDWAKRKNAPPKAGKYTWLGDLFEYWTVEPRSDMRKERDYSDDNADDNAASGFKDADAVDGDVGEGKGKERAKTPAECTAPPEVQLPLGKLSKATILQGFTVLKTLSEVINNPQGDVARQNGGFATACQTLSGSYYSVIPHLFNRSQRPTTINTVALLKRELDLVDALGDMTIATKLLQSATSSDGSGVHPIDARVQSLNLKTIEPLPKDSKEFATLVKYCDESRGVTHGHLNGKVADIFRVVRNGEEDLFVGGGYDKLGPGQRMLLWHGSRTTNFGGILSQGLRIAPPEAPVSGYMFGKGVYFADASSKSLGYTYHHLSNNTGLLLLCEVAVNPFLELGNAAYDAGDQCKTADKLATKGVGTYQPSGWGDVADLTGNEELRNVSMPVGPLARADKGSLGGYLYYNEYIVYDTAQIRLRYLLKVEF
ncbi:hypothetical protein FRB99_001559, partial [Tulasnella sp. 403]